MWGGLLQDTVSSMGDMVHLLFPFEGTAAQWGNKILKQNYHFKLSFFSISPS
jgi:hypothetical protein